MEFAKDCDSKTFFNAEAINGIPQEDAGPAASQVVDVINDFGEINYSVEGVVQDKFSFESSKKDDINTEKIQKSSKTSSQKGQDVTVPFTTTKQQREALKRFGEQADYTSERSKTQNTMNYPSVDDRTVDEYDTSIDAFGMVFMAVFWWLRRTI